MNTFYAAPNDGYTSHDTSGLRIFGLAVTGLILVMLAGCQSAFVPPVSDPFANPTQPRFTALESPTYRLSDGYYNKLQGTVTQHVDKIDGDRVTVSVEPTTPRAGMARNEIYTADGNWVQHQLYNHNDQIIYEFSTPLPAYVFPLTPDKSWRQRVSANAAGQGARSVLIIGKVMRAERIIVPAGEFDTIKIRRDIYPGDDPETHYTEFEWYAPILGRAVRIVGYSEWKWRPTCDFMFCDPAYGDLNVYELQTLAPAPVAQAQ